MRPPRNPRLRLLAAALLVGGLAVTARLVQLTVFAAGTLGPLARAQNEDVIPIPGPRGDIVDRHGRTLATSVPVRVLAVEPREITAAGLAAIERAAGAPGRLAGRGAARWFLVRRDCDQQAVDAVEQLVRTGVVPKDAIHWAPGFKRHYPHGTTAAHVLGFVSLDETIAEGIEKEHDDYLRSGTLRALRATDARGTGIGESGLAAPTPPPALMLTLDLRIQKVLEAELERARIEHGARGAQGIVLDPATGEVLALANVPTYDPNAYGAADASARRNLAIELPFEPGSVMKPLTATALAAYDLANDAERVWCEQGAWSRGAWTLRDTHPYGWLTLPEVIAVSSNIGIVKFAQRVSPERLHAALTALGLGRRTGIDLPAENAGRLAPYKKWRSTDRDTIAFGHSLTLTTLQLASAYGTIANGGVRVQPHVGRALGDPDGDWHPLPAAARERALAEQAAGRVALWMLGVIEAERATGHRAAVAGYRVAGKTGTAEKITNGRYDRGKNIGTFAGFAPLRDPAAVAVISLDEPTIGSHTGGIVAAPAFANVMSETLRLLRVTPDYLPEMPPPPPPHAAKTATQKKDRTRAPAAGAATSPVAAGRARG